MCVWGGGNNQYRGGKKKGKRKWPKREKGERDEFEEGSVLLEFCDLADNVSMKVNS